MADLDSFAEAPAPEPDEPESKLFGFPLYVWVVLAAVAAVPVGLAWGKGAAALDILPRLIIKLIKALATPLIVLAILSALVSNVIRGRQGARMMFYYLVNTIVAITIGLVFSNLIRPGVGSDLLSKTAAVPGKLIGGGDGSGGSAALKLLEDLIPESIGESFVRNHLAQLVIITLALGIGLTRIRDEQRAKGLTSVDTVIDLVNVGFELLMRVLIWVVNLVPLAVFGVVASNLGQRGLESFRSLLWFILVVLAGLACQICWYLGQMAVFAKMSPWRFLVGAKNVMVTTLSTASTGATMPITLKALTGPLGISRQSSQLAACVGTNFNNDGTALYQASVVLFMAQAMGVSLSLTQQLIVVITTVIASIGAGNIPSGGFVTLPLIFAAVGLPADQIPIILTIDWFLDRCRTTSNVLGDMTVAVLLDQTAEKAAPLPDS